MIPRYRSPLSLWEAMAGARSGSGEAVPSGLPGLPIRTRSRFTASGADALVELLQGWGACGQVLFPAYTCVRVLQAIQAAGWQAHAVDVDPASGGMDPEAVRAMVRQMDGPVVLLPTHLHGIPADLAVLAQACAGHPFLMVEDCALAQGALAKGVPVGQQGAAALFSFGPGKAWGIGCGGAWLADRAVVPVSGAGAVSTLRSGMGLISRSGWLGTLRFHAQEALKQVMPGLATASRPHPKFVPRALPVSLARALYGWLSRPRAAIWLGQLRERHARWNNCVQAIASRRLRLLPVQPGDQPCAAGLALMVADRDALQAELRRIGVDTATTFNYVAGTALHNAGFPGASAMARQMLLLPLLRELDRRAQAVTAVLHRHAR